MKREQSQQACCNIHRGFVIIFPRELGLCSFHTLPLPRDNPSFVPSCLLERGIYHLHTLQSQTHSSVDAVSCNQQRINTVFRRMDGEQLVTHLSTRANSGT